MQQSPQDKTTTDPKRASWQGMILLAAVLALAAWSHVDTLDHDYLPGWDEAVHAAVSGNLAKNPLTPKLFDRPFIGFRRHDWQANEIWLLMPPLSFWQAAASIAVGGRSFFFLRLPSLILFLLTLAGVYYLGLRLYSEAAGLLAALWMSICPFAWLQVQGYHFGDMTDISLAFWLTATMVCVERALARGGLRWAIGAGICQGAALLTKSALALAPAGACLAVWVLSRAGFRLNGKVRWHLPALQWGLGLAMAMAWRLYSSLRWPVEFAYEQKALWAHVVSSYEGHGRPWDALFNDLIGKLFTPAFILVVLAGALFVVLLAWRKRSSPVALHALWMIGTWVPLLFVKTKVPALLFGIFPALALAGAALISSVIRRAPGPLASACLLTPVAFLLVSGHTPGDFWRFAEGVTPAMAIWPHLPLQLGLLLSGTVVFFAARKLLAPLLRKRGSLARATRVIWRFVVSACVCAAFIWLTIHMGNTRRGFDIIKSYNPISKTAAMMRDKLPDDSAIIIEGRTNGRQRPDLTVSFMTGKPTHLVTSGAVARTVTAALELGEVFLLTSVQRSSRPWLPPRPGSAYWVYPVTDELPAPQMENPEENDEPKTRYPELIGLTPGRQEILAGSALDVLAKWRINGSARACYTTASLLRIDDGRPESVIPRQEDFPTGYEATILHTLAPPGLLWGLRPLGSDLLDLHTLRAGQLLADGFVTWIPVHVRPGSYLLQLDIVCGGTPVHTAGDIEWPMIRVIR